MDMSKLDVHTFVRYEVLTVVYLRIDIFRGVILCWVGDS
jgi:hypothetical protein